LAQVEIIRYLRITVCVTRVLNNCSRFIDRGSSGSIENPHYKSNNSIDYYNVVHRFYNTIIKLIVLNMTTP
jgi:hypothetical protein